MSIKVTVSHLHLIFDDNRSFLKEAKSIKLGDKLFVINNGFA